MMSSAILKFAEQFAFEPIIKNKSCLKKYRKYIVIGMGGSHLAADLALIWKPSLPIVVWSDYGLPIIPASEAKQTCVIASSYSGNTEETIDGFNLAIKKRLPVSVIATGGKLLDMARHKKIPYVELPNTGIQPRSALGFNLRALFALMREKQGLNESKKLFGNLNPKNFENAGKTLADSIKNRIPVIYASRANAGIAYNWKIKFNETGKIPAFCNVIPELNHNEMTGFDAKQSSKHLSERFFFIFLKDSNDNPKIQKRMDVLKKLYLSRDLPVEILELSGKSVFERIFSSLILADWTAVNTAAIYGLESEQVPMVEEFKKLI